MKSVRLITLLSVTFLVAPALLAGSFGVRAGRYNDSDRNFVGVETAINLGAITLNPNLEYQTGGNGTAGSANLDLLVDLAHISNLTPYAGGGVGLLYVDPDTGSSDTDVLGNLIGGVRLQLDRFEPYFQVKYFRSFDQASKQSVDHDLAFAVGLRF